MMISLFLTTANADAQYSHSLDSLCFFETLKLNLFRNTNHGFREGSPREIRFSLVRAANISKVVTEFSVWDLFL